MRFHLTVLLILAGTTACNRAREAPTESAAAAAKTYEVTKKGKLVLTVTDAPGLIVSAAVRPPDGAAATNPFLSASAHAPEEEDALRKLLEQSKSTQDFIARLRKAGYEVAPR